MKKIKTLIVIDNLHTGGVATSLYNYLYFVHDKMDCTLLCFNEDSMDTEKIPSDISIIKPAKALHILGKSHKEIKAESLFMMLYRLVMIFVARYINGVLARNLIWPLVKKSGQYDLAIAYAQDDSWNSISKGCIDYIVKKVAANNKAVIVHCDYSNFGGYSPKQEKMFARLDNIICVSESCVNRFVQCFPSLKGKTIACENFTKVEEIRQLAGGGVKYSTDRVNFVSACRLSTVKGLDRAIRALGKIKNDGISNFTWTIVGGGPEENNLKSMVSQLGLSEHIDFVGNKDNPYPYIKNASYFLLPSVHEAAPMVFGESAALSVPVLSTNTCSAVEMVEKRGLGIVMDNSEEAIERTLRMILLGQKSVSLSDYDIKLINAKAKMQFASFIDILK